MEEINNFMNLLINVERDALYYRGYKEKINDYNKAVRELNLFASYLMPPLMREHDSPPFSERFYKEIIEFEEPTIPRHLFKISQYTHPRYDYIWACYVSVPNPSIKVKRISDCFLVSEIKGDLKVIVKLGIDPDTNKWTFYGGDEDKSLRLYNLGTPVNVKRYVEPLNDEFGLKEYLKNS